MNRSRAIGPVLGVVALGVGVCGGGCDASSSGPSGASTSASTGSASGSTSGASSGTGTGGAASSSAATSSSSSGSTSGSTSGSSSSGDAATGLHAVMGSSGHAGHLEDASGNVVVLHGTDESGTENYCLTWGPPPIVISPQGGFSPLTQDSLTAMKSWGINAVRIPLNEDCWLGINGVAASVGAANYQSPIQSAVDLITKTNGMYVILDLHITAPGTTQALSQAPMADLDHSVAFWQQVAAAYKDNGSVVFDLFNEPFFMSGTNDQQFACWKSGSTSANGGACPMVDFAVAGMDTLLSTVRAAGAKNLVMMGGPGYSSQLGLWAQYAPTDTLSPPNLAASWHVYDDQGGCTSDAATSLATLCPTTGLGAEALMAAGYPIIVGETNYYSCSTSVGQAWWPIFLSWADSQGISTLAWSWSTANNPQLLENTTSFTPNANGQIYKSWLSCIGSKTVTPAASCTTVPTTGCE